MHVFTGHMPTNLYVVEGPRFPTSPIIALDASHRTMYNHSYRRDNQINTSRKFLLQQH